jgi:hypothetical protein
MDGAEPRRRPRSAVPASLAALVLTVVSVDVWWVVANRRGYPFDIDEAGYLSRALVDADILRNGGVGALAAHVHGPDPQAPLLPVTAGILHVATGVGPVGMLVTQQLFLVVLLASTYCIGRRLGGRAQALVATALVAGCPGIVDASRSFGFALVAVSTVVAVLAVQLWAGSFDRWPRALVWGVVLGVAALSRTMVLGILPGLVLAAVIVVTGPGPRVRRTMTLVSGLVLATAVAWSWYSASWRNVERYLTSFGYGSAGHAYGHPLPPWSVRWWTIRATTLVDTGLLLPGALAVVGCLAAGVVVRIGHPAPAVAPILDGSAAGAGVDRLDRLDYSARVFDWLRGDRGTVTVVLAWSYLVLSSTANVGSGFVLVLAPPVILLSVSFAAAALDAHRRTLTTVLVASAVVAATSFAATSWPRATSGPVVASVLGWRVPVVDAGGTLRAVVTGGAVDHRLPTSTVDRALRAEAIAVRAVAVLVQRSTPPGPAPPLVALATSDQFLNVNSIGLAVLERTGVAPSMMLLRTPSGGFPAITRQVSGPPRVDIVVVGPNAGGHRVRSYLSMGHPLAVVPVLATSGFHRLGTVRLPDGRTLQVWTRATGTR